MVKELKIGPEVTPVKRGGSTGGTNTKVKSIAPQAKPTKYARPKAKPFEPGEKKPVIAFYRNTEKSGWQLFPEICYNAKVAKRKIYIISHSEIVKCMDLPEDLQDG